VKEPSRLSVATALFQRWFLWFLFVVMGCPSSGFLGFSEAFNQTIWIASPRYQIGLAIQPDYGKLLVRYSPQSEGSTDALLVIALRGYTT
jgi:hypothetical protein